jgi:hypothetical protein
MEETIEERVREIINEWKPLLDYLEREDVRRAKRIKAKNKSS